MAKFVIALCASALFVQAISGNCLGSRPATMIKAAAPAINIAAPAAVQIAAPCGAGRPAAVQSAAGAYLPASSSGGAFPTSSAAPIAASGLTVLSELIIEGPLAVWGEMPFVSTVAFDSQLPTSGFAVADYSCGDGNIGITSESAAPAYNEYSYGAAAYTAPAYAASAYAAPAHSIAAAPALAPAIGIANGPMISSGFAPSKCGCY